LTAEAAPTEQSTKTLRWQFAVASGILGWILDAYFLFILILLLDTLTARFGVSKAAIIWSITVIALITRAGCAG
jgi:SHS family lactate transporter-like MFS transporter